MAGHETSTARNADGHSVRVLDASEAFRKKTEINAELAAACRDDRALRDAIMLSLLGAGLSSFDKALRERVVGNRRENGTYDGQNPDLWFELEDKLPSVTW